MVYHGLCLPSFTCINIIPIPSFINDIVKASQKFVFILYADDTTLNSTLDIFRNDPENIRNSMVRELKKLFKWLDINILCLNVTKSKFMIFQMPQKKVPQLLFNIDGLHIDQLYKFNFLGYVIDANLNWKAHLMQLVLKFRESSACSTK